MRSLVNGIKRAFGSPKRLLGVLFFLGYYWFLFMRPFAKSGGSKKSPFSPQMPTGKFEFPSLEVLDAVLFGGFAFMTLLLSVGIFSYQSTFKAADVDVLFPTPVPPRVVLIFRFVRDTFFTLLTPLFIGFFVYQPSSEWISRFFKGYPDQSYAMLRLATIAWVLLALAWTSVGYSVSLLAGRDDPGAQRASRMIKWGLPVFIFAPMIIFGIRLYLDPSWAGAARASHDPVLRGILFLATSATSMTLSGATGGFGPGALVGAAVLLGTIVAAFSFALAQAPWLYDAAASRGGDDKSTVRELARKNDYSGIRTLAAQKGKYRKARLAAKFAQRTVSGAKAIIWREVVVTLRAGFVGNVIGSVMATAFPPFFLLIPDKKGVTQYMYLGFSAMMLSILAMGSGNMNFIETLRKVDTTKPLPFAPQKVVAYEVLSKSLMPMAFSVVPFLIGFAIRPSAWGFHLTGLLLACPLVFMVSSVMFLVAILFPDFEDPTQRGFRGMVMLLATVCAIVPVFLFPAGAILLGQSPLVGVPFSIVAAAIVSGLALLWSGRLYSDYNPSE